VPANFRIRTLVWAVVSQAPPSHHDRLARGGRARPQKRELVWVADDSLLSFTRDERTVVISGTPASYEVRTVMRQFATGL
jgi:hypothetical protein